MSITIINNIDPKAPAWVYDPMPKFRTLVERDRYNDFQMKRWIEGYAGLTGRHYFYLQECKIKTGTEGKLIRPIWRDVDQWIFEAIDKAEMMRYNLGVLKRREVGLTSIGAGCLPNYTMKVFPGSSSIITSCDKDRVFAMFNDKTTAVYDNLRESIKPAEHRRNQTKNMAYLQTTLNVKGEEGNEEIASSEIFLSETSHNDESTKAFSSKRAKYGFYDEFPLHTRRQKLLDSSESCFMESTLKTGFLLWGGTVEKGITTETLRALRTIVGDANYSKTYIFMVEFWMGLKEFMINGHSDRQKGEEWWEQECERLNKLQDKDPLESFKKNYPKNLEMALESSATGVLPQFIMEILARQRKMILTERPPVSRYRLQRNPQGTVTAIPDNNGLFYILVHPKKGVRYISGTDPIPFNSGALESESEKKDDEKSEYAINIKDRDAQQYVAYYAQRSLDSRYIVEQAIMLQDYYYGAKTMMELNAGGVAVREYSDLGRRELLAPKPTAVGIKFTDDKKTSKGFYKNDKVSPTLNKLYINYLKQYGDTVWFMRMIEESEEFLIENTDVLDSMQATELYEDHLVKTEKKSQGDAKRSKQIPVMSRDENGKTIQVWKTIYI